MFARQVTISEDTMKNNKLTKERRTELREEAVMSYIKSRPSGSRIKNREFQQIIGLTTYQGTRNFIDKMIDKGLIAQTQESPHSHSYTVVRPTPPTTSQFVPPPKVEITAKPDLPIADLAKQFAWDYNSDSLREFIK